MTETLAYDAAKRPTSISISTSGTASRLSEAYDRGGHVASEGRSLTGIAGVAGSGTQSFATDGLGRVTTSSGISPSATYSYDLDGNRIAGAPDGASECSPDAHVVRVVKGAERIAIWLIPSKRAIQPDELPNPLGSVTPGPEHRLNPVSGSTVAVTPLPVETTL